MSATKLVNSRTAAEMLAISARTLWAVTHPRGPLPVVKIGRAVRFDVVDLREFIASQRQAVAPTSNGNGTAVSAAGE